MAKQKLKATTLQMAQARISLATPKPEPKTTPPSEGEYASMRVQLALEFCPPIRRCKNCQWPYVAGYCCRKCGSLAKGEEMSKAKVKCKWSGDENCLDGIVRIGRLKVAEITVWSHPYMEDGKIKEDVRSAITLLSPYFGRYEIKLPPTTRTLEAGRDEVVKAVKALMAQLADTAAALTDL